MKPNTPYRDYGMWRLMAWCGPVFFIVFFFLWGLLARNFPPAAASLTADQIYAHYIQYGLAIRIGMSVCMVAGAFYVAWSVAVSRVMRRIEGPDGMMANLEMMGGTATFTPIVVACGMWLAASVEAPNLQPEIVHLLYWMAWLIIDLAYMVTTFQMFGASIVFLRDPREKPLIPKWVSWWGFITCVSFFPVSLIPFFKTGPFAFNGLFNFWVAFPTWYIWIVSMSICIIKAINRLEIEDGARQEVRKEASGGIGAPAYSQS